MEENKEKQKKSNLIRAHRKFIDEIREIIEKRKNGGIHKLSWAKITLLITKHRQWKNMKADLINYLGNENE